MIDLKDYLIEQFLQESAESNQSILYKLGLIYLNNRSDISSIKKKYGIKGTDSRSQIITMIKDLKGDLPKPSEEIIQRSKWDTDSLIGETEEQLMHEAFWEAEKYILGHKSEFKKHDVLFVSQCTGSKPYNRSEGGYRLLLKYKDVADIVCMSTPGIVPFSISHLYPYRYDEWDTGVTDKFNEEVNMDKKYTFIAVCRCLRYLREMGYKKVVICIYNPRRNAVWEYIQEYNLENFNDYGEVLLNGSFLNNVLDNYPGFKKVGGLVYTRLRSLPETAKRIGKLLKSNIGRLSQAIKDKISKIYKSELDRIKEEQYEPEYNLITEDYDVMDELILEARDYSKIKPTDEKPGMKKDLSYDDMMSAFKKHIKPQMDKPDNIDKGKNNMYYKSYYWTLMDLVMIGCGNNLLEDINTTYFNLLDRIKKDNDWEELGPRIFTYKPLNRNDDIPAKDMLAEADKFGLVWKQKEFKIK